MALDVGTKNIGIAVSDADEKWAFPAGTLARREGYRKDMAALSGIVDEREVKEVVVGLPLTMDGEDGPAAVRSRVFVEQLQRYVSCPIHLHDERLTSWAANQMMIEAGTPRRRRESVIDSAAAVLILESFLQYRSHQAAS